MGYFTIGGAGSGSSSSRWSGKTWNALGDSNTEDNFRADKKYLDYIATRINCITNNYGYSGYGYLDKGDGKNVYSKIEQMDPGADLITVLAGGNDVGYVHNSTIPLGNFGDSDPSQSFYGALDHTIKMLVDKYPTKTVAALSQVKRGEGREETIQSMVKALKDVCGKYGVPVLDLYNGGNIHAYNSEYISQCMPHGVHLNDLGSELISWKIQSFIEGL